MHNLTGKRLFLSIATIAMVGAIMLAFTAQRGRPWQSRIFPPPEYLNVDSPEWLGIVDSRPFLKSTIPMHVSRPLYPGPAYFVKHFISPGINTLTLLRLTNLAWLLACCAGLYWWSLRWTGDVVPSAVSVVLLVFSPYVQIYASQPVPTIIGNAVSLLPLLFVATLTTSRWKTHPSAWVAAGILSALLMLGKEVYAVYLCLAILALLRKAWKPMLAFGAGAILVHVSWMSWVKWGIGRSYSPYGTNQQGFLSWVSADFLPLGFPQQMAFCARLVARIAVRTLQAFEIWPLALAAVGFLWLPRRPWKELAAYCFAFYAMFFAMNLVTPRICFLMFPAILPPAAVALVAVWRKLQVRSPLLAAAWTLLIIALIIGGAIVDPYRFFYYG